jgi:hypothetical protein
MCHAKVTLDKYAWFSFVDFLTEVLTEKVEGKNKIVSSPTIFSQINFLSL